MSRGADRRSLAVPAWAAADSPPLVACAIASAVGQCLPAGRHGPAALQ